MTSDDLKQWVSKHSKISRTPLLPIDLLVQRQPKRLFLKLEGENPSGSIKHRTAQALLCDLTAKSKLRAGTMIVESTSGNLGSSMAHECNERGLGFTAVVDPKTTAENIARMKALGACVEAVCESDADGNYLAARLRRVQELLQSNRSAVWPCQYSNRANPLAHYTFTGPEVYEQMGRDVGAIFVAVGTGGTLAGVSRFFREVSPRTRVIAVDAIGSSIFGTPAGPRKLVGVGSTRRSDFIRSWHYDLLMQVSDAAAFACCRALAARTGMSLGGSSGALIAACTTFMEINPDAERAVCICPDGGSNYSSTIYNEGWLQENQLYDRQLAFHYYSQLVTRPRAA